LIDRLALPTHAAPNSMERQAQTGYPVYNEPRGTAESIRWNPGNHKAPYLPT